jgi:hypothetical protein
MLDAAGTFLGLHLEAWRSQCYEMSTAATQEAKRKSFERVRKSMQADGLLTVANGIYRVTEPGTSIRGGQYARAANPDNRTTTRQVTDKSGDIGRTGQDTTLEGCPDVRVSGLD